MKISDERQLVFYCAVPGSGWAKLSLLLQCCSKLKLNTSDRTPEREERGRLGDTGVVFHKGAFWDPKMECGTHFDDIGENYTKDEFIDECLRPFTDVNGEDNYLIKSHFFAETKNLEWLTTNFPNNKIIFVLRETKLCYEGWNTGMTFTKHYPKYLAWMKYTFIDNHPENQAKLWQLIQKHDRMIRQFILDNDDKIDIKSSVISHASAPASALAPVLTILQAKFGIKCCSYTLLKSIRGHSKDSMKCTNLGPSSHTRHSI